MKERTQRLIDECRRQEESCLYTSVTLFEWLKRMRWWKAAFVVVPIIFGTLATWPFLRQDLGLEWLTGMFALLAGLATAIYKALDFDVSLSQIAKHAHQFKILQDRFRQAQHITALGEFSDFEKEFSGLMTQMDAARSSSLTPPERFFKKARSKVQLGHYDFAVDQNRSLDRGRESGAINGSAAQRQPEAH